MAGINGVGAVNAYAAQAEISRSAQLKNTDETKKKSGVSKTSDVNKTGGASLGKTIGEPKLSEKAQKYYDQLKAKYGNYDFILVSEDEKENAKANAGRYANSLKTVVLIDEDKIERMASDAEYRKKYEGILSGATSQLNQLKESVIKSGAEVKGYGMQVNDNGTASYFAVLKDSSNAQKARIEKKAAQRKADKKAAEKKTAKKEAKERLEKARSERSNKSEKLKESDEDTIVISANSVEELTRKLDEYVFNKKSDSVQTEEEKQVGQNIDFKG